MCVQGCCSEAEAQQAGRMHTTSQPIQCELPTIPVQIGSHFLKGVSFNESAAENLKLKTVQPLTLGQLHTSYIFFILQKNYIVRYEKDLSLIRFHLSTVLLVAQCFLSCQHTMLQLIKEALGQNGVTPRDDSPVTEVLNQVCPSSWRGACKTAVQLLFAQAGLVSGHVKNQSCYSSLVISIRYHVLIKYKFGLYSSILNQVGYVDIVLKLTFSAITRTASTELNSSMSHNCC